LACHECGRELLCAGALIHLRPGTTSVTERCAAYGVFATARLERQQAIADDHVTGWQRLAFSIHEPVPGASDQRHIH